MACGRSFGASALGYNLHPATTDAEFADWSAKMWLPRRYPGLAWAEIRRPVESLPRSACQCLSLWLASFSWSRCAGQVRLKQPSVCR